MLVSIGNHELLLQTVLRMQQMCETEMDRAIEEQRILDGLKKQMQDAQSQMKERMDKAIENVQRCQETLENARIRAASAADRVEELQNK